MTKPVDNKQENLQTEGQIDTLPMARIDAGELEESIDINEIAGDCVQGVEDILKNNEADISNEEISALQDAWPDLFKNTSPEFALLLNEVREKIAKLQTELDAIIEKGDHLAAAELLMNFLRKQETEIATKLPEGPLKAQIMEFVAIALNAAVIGENAERQHQMQKNLLKWQLLPVTSQALLYSEAARGKSWDGVKLSQNERLWKVAEATATLAVDALAVGSLFVGAAPAGAAVEGVKAGVVAKKGYDAGRVVCRLAALMRMNSKYAKASKALFKAGRVLRENPALMNIVMDYASIARDKNRANVVSFSKAAEARKIAYESLKNSSERKAA